MLEEKKPAWLVVAGIIGLVVFIIIGAILLFTDKKEAPVETQVPENVPVESTSTPPVATIKVVATSTDLVKIIDKDSILKSTDGGDSFSPYFKISTNNLVGVANVLGITFHPTQSGRVVVGSLEDGLFFKNTGEDVWGPIIFPPKKIYSFILDKKEPNQRMFASGVVDGNGRIFRTNDGGESWKAVYVEPGQASTVTALSQNPRSTNIIYAGTSLGTVIKSVDGGNTWKNVGNKITGLIKDISFDATKTAVVYLLSYQKKSYYSPDEGARWIDWEVAKAAEVAELTKRSSEASRAGDKSGAATLKAQADALRKKNLTNKMPAGINLIVADPSISGTIYAGTKSGLFRSKDFGKYWGEVEIIESAKGFPIRSIAVNPKNSKELVFVSGKAFYKSQNSGVTWAVTPLSSERTASFVAYDPFDLNSFYVGVSSIEQK